MVVLLWLARAVAGIAALLTLVMALSRQWSGAAEGLVLALFILRVGERCLAPAVQRLGSKPGSVPSKDR